MKFDQIRIDNIRLDPLNPRLPSKIRGDFFNEKNAIEWIYYQTSLYELIVSILQNDFFEGEPPIVVNESGENVVLEGNRRITALKILNDTSLVGKESETIIKLRSEYPEFKNLEVLNCAVFDHRHEVLTYLGYRHVTGIKSWGSLAKSRYLKQLLADPSIQKFDKDERYKRLARAIGAKRSDYVQRLLISYDLFEILKKKNFFEIEGLSEESIIYSNFYDTCTIQTNVVAKLNIKIEEDDPLSELNLTEFKKIIRVLFDPNIEPPFRIKESRDIRVFNKVIASEKAYQAFIEKKTSLKTALLYSTNPQKVFDSCINTSHKNIIEANRVKKEESIVITEELASIIDDLVRNLNELK